MSSALAMSGHRGDVWRDVTAPRRSMFAWRSRCTCRGLPKVRGWWPPWASRTHAGALALVCAHIADPHPDDHLLDERTVTAGPHRRTTP